MTDRARKLWGVAVLTPLVVTVVFPILTIPLAALRINLPDWSLGVAIGYFVAVLGTNTVMSIVSIVHVVRHRETRGTKAAWIAGLILGSGIVGVAYWYVHIRQDQPAAAQVAG